MSLDFPFRPGVKPAHPDFVKPRLWVDDFLPLGDVTGTPTTADWGTLVTGWQMSLNDQLGTCGIAGMNNWQIAASTYGDGVVQPWPDSTITRLYEILGGYVPGDPSTDNGTVLQDNLAFWRRNPIEGKEILAFGALKPGSWLRPERLEALRGLGPLYLGLALPVSAVDAFPQPWVYVPGSPLAGGHCVIQPAEMMGTNELRYVTWAQLIHASARFMLSAVQEAWVIIDQQAVERNGRTQYGVDLTGMNQALAALTGQSNPLRLKTIL